MRGLPLFLLVLTVAFNARSQYSKTIETDRPGEGKSAFVQSFKSFQAEFGLQQSKEGTDAHIFLHPEFTLRYGITNWLEGRMQSNVRTEKYGKEKQTGLEPLRIGVKALLTKGSTVIPHISLLLQAGIPFLATKDFQPPHIAPNARLLFQNEITDQFNITYNIGAEWDGYSTNPEYVFSISPEYLIAEKIQLFAELYGFAEQHESARTTVDAGIGYLLNDDVKIDFNAGWGISSNASDHFYAVGLSIRLK
ncbi:MAG TPA: transporter [Flavitalea sp.]|nr:transporter [Flavitalea sp.]